jgi:hypothetical protein
LRVSQVDECTPIADGDTEYAGARINSDPTVAE